MRLAGHHRTLVKMLAVSLIAVLLSGCSSNWGWYVVSPMTKSGMNNLLFLIGGLKYTLLLSVTAIMISVVVGLLVALPGLSENRALKLFNRTYVECIRAIPIPRRHTVDTPRPI